MSKWRLAVLAALVLAPLLLLLGAGWWFLWSEGHWTYLWWPATGCIGAAYLLGWYWQRCNRLLPPTAEPALHWADRDREAWKLVEARAKTVVDIPSSRLTSLPFYTETATTMTNELAHFYHPHATDPVGALTIPEILTVVELAAHDMAELVNRYVPGGHMMTIDRWRGANKMVGWYNTANKAYWAISALFYPITTAARFTASTLGLSGPWQLLQDNLLAWFSTAYVHRLGNYLIELNSGRLRVGALRYRELMTQAQQPTPPIQDTGATTSTSLEVIITIAGQVKAGKSSLVNALLGERRAATDVAPVTNEFTRYELSAPALQDRLILLDTVGYANEGPRGDQLKALESAIQQSDLVLLVLNARDPARQPDLELIRSLQSWWESNPRLKRPAIIGVLTHIDLLSPVMEWSPPYDWIHGDRLKERSIHAAVDYVTEQLGKVLGTVCPVCTAPGRVYGVTDELLPSIVEHVDEARAVALLRCLHAEADESKLRRVFRQLLQSGKQLLHAAREGGKVRRETR